LELLDHEHRGHTGGDRAADHEALLLPVQALEQSQQAVERQSARGGERI